MGKARFGFITSGKHQGLLIFGEDSYGSTGEHYFWPKCYSSAKLAQKRIDKLEKAGVRCKLTGYNGGYIQFLGHTPETEEKLEQERQEFTLARKEWEKKQQVQTAK